LEREDAMREKVYLCYGYYTRTTHELIAKKKVIYEGRFSLTFFRNKKW